MVEQAEVAPAKAGTPAPPGVSAPLFVAALHGVRGLAVAGVVLVHAAIAVNWLPLQDLPRALVDSGFLVLTVLFFVTGFVLFLPVALEGGLGDVRSFFIRRFGRLVPAYYVCLLVILIAFPLLTSEAKAATAPNGVTDYLVHAVFLQREILLGYTGLGVNAPLWALSMDVVFYLLLPLIAGAYLRHPVAGFALALGISALWRSAFLEISPQVALTLQKVDLLIQFPLFTADFAAGMTAAWLFVKLRSTSRWPPSPAVAFGVVAGAVVALVGIAYAAGSNMPLRPVPLLHSVPEAAAFPVVLVVFVLGLCALPRWAQWPLTNRAIVWFSEISFSIYLYHALAIGFAVSTLGLSTSGSPKALLVLVIVTLSITIPIAVLSYRFVELPSRRYARRLAERVRRGNPRKPGDSSAARTPAVGPTASSNPPG